MLCLSTFAVRLQRKKKTNCWQFQWDIMLTQPVFILRFPLYYSVIFCCARWSLYFEYSSIYCLSFSLAALCFAELRESVKREGVEYAYITEAFGPVAGFAYTWMRIGKFSRVANTYWKPICLLNLQHQTGVKDAANTWLIFNIFIVIKNYLVLIGYHPNHRTVCP